MHINQSIGKWGLSMTDSIMEWVRRIAVFYIMTDIFIAVIPGKTCRKHVKMFAGIILALLVTEPVISLAGSRFDLASALGRELDNAYTADMKMWTKAVGSDEDVLLEPYTDELKKMIDTKAWEYALYVQDCRIDICLDRDSGDYGKIQSVYVTVSRCRDDTAIDPVTIEDIDVGKKTGGAADAGGRQQNGQHNGQQNGQKTADTEDKDCAGLRDYIAERFGIETESITIICR